MESGEYRQQINEMLVEIFHTVVKLEQNAVAGFADVPLTMSEMHIIEAVGNSQGRQMSDIAKRLRVTLPTLTVSADRLVEKGFLSRQRDRQDRRRVEIELTPMGQGAYQAHEQFHGSMVQSLYDELNLDQKPELLESLAMLSRFFKGLAARQRK